MRKRNAEERENLETALELRIDEAKESSRIIHKVQAERRSVHFEGF